MNERLYSPLVLGKMTDSSPRAAWNHSYTTTGATTSGNGPLLINQPRVMYTAAPTSSTYATASSVLSNVIPAGTGG